jgi:hypothetical protein
MCNLVYHDASRDKVMVGPGRSNYRLPSLFANTGTMISLSVLYSCVVLIIQRHPQLEPMRSR